MTMRESYENWCQDNAPRSFHMSDYDLWQAAYRAGQEAMRERAAKVAEHYSHEPVACSDHIRALPLDDQP